MKEKFKLYGSIFILVIFVPFLLLLWVEGGFGGRQADPVQQQIEEALPFVVAKEVSVGSRTETLKAQAVIARTKGTGRVSDFMLKHMGAIKLLNCLLFLFYAVYFLLK